MKDIQRRVQCINLTGAEVYKMKVYQSWTRNTPSSAGGYSITVTTTYSSNIKGEIDELEKKMPKGMLVMDTDKPDGAVKV